MLVDLLHPNTGSSIPLDTMCCHITGSQQHSTCTLSVANTSCLYLGKCTHCTQLCRINPTSHPNTGSSIPLDTMLLQVLNNTPHALLSVANTSCLYLGKCTHCTQLCRINPTSHPNTGSSIHAFTWGNVHIVPSCAE